FFRPVIGYYTYNLNNFLDEIEIIDNKHELLKAVIGTMLNSLFEMAYKTLVLETNAAGMDGKLAGESPAERAEYFADVLLRDETCLRNIYEEYAELTRLMKLKVKNICSYVKEIIVNTKNEYDHLTFLFCNGESLGKIKAISFGSGDSHNSGKTVAKLLFTSGRILIYKPRALEIEKGYFNFIRWINAQPISGFKILKAPMVHYINDAGWMEYIEYIHCDNKDQVQHFYSRIGQLLCILYILNARDFHFENIIACGEQPILIDLETLFNPEILNIEPGNANASETAMRIINNSVKCISLLPTQIVNPKNNKVIEVGGLSHKDRQLSPFKQYYIKDIDSDEIRVESAYGYVEGKDNSPSLNGDRINSANYLNEIKEGFVNTYEWIQENKGLFLEEVKYEFKDMLCRIVYRPTNLYLQLLATSYHPNLLRKKADRKVYLHRIGLVADEREKTILYSELEQMLDSDVPYFSARFNGDWLLNNKHEAIFQLNTGSVFNNIARKTNSLCTEDLKWQLSVINYSYSSNTEACQNRRTKTCFKNDIKK
ncbi:MAG TPA: type 2 lanthipeptide synthetase LanM, partial [Ruminiclostridium sp.]|nr:type 2 lanthipeptide synthetase LanM [Ruminiclostridium sp.]